MMRKTNKIEKININCATKIEQLEQMYDLVCKFKDKYSQYKRMVPIEKRYSIRYTNYATKKNQTQLIPKRKLKISSRINWGNIGKWELWYPTMAMDIQRNI